MTHVVLSICAVAQLCCWAMQKGLVLSNLEGLYRSVRAPF